MSGTEDELRARDVLRELRVRAALGARLVSRVGARGWSPPRFSLRGRRLYERCGVPDPWDPDAPAFDVALGDVGLAGRTPGRSVDPSARRSPAPHAAPPAEKAQAAAATFRPSVPSASDASRAPTGRPAPQIGDRRPDDTAEMKRKLTAKPAPGAPPSALREPVRVQQPVRALPVRPDLAARPDPAERAPAPPASRPQRPVGAAPSRVALPPPRRAASGPVELPFAPQGRAAEEEDSLGPGDFVPVQRPFEPAASGSEPPLVVRPPPVPPSVPPPMARPTAVPAPAPIPSGPPSPPSRTPPRAGGGNLDDLFGMGGAEQTRVRFDRPAADESRPRRPRVSDPASLAGGIDRRPPPPRLPEAPPASPVAAPPAAPTIEDEPEE